MNTLPISPRLAIWRRRTDIPLLLIAVGSLPLLLLGTPDPQRVQAMLDAVVHYLPSPDNRPPVKGIDEKEQEAIRKVGDKEPFSALAFKIMTDPFVGSLTFFRVYSGTLNAGDQVYNPVKSKKERIGRILQMHANEREELASRRDKAHDCIALGAWVINAHAMPPHGDVGEFLLLRHHLRRTTSSCGSTHSSGRPQSRTP